MGAATVRLLPRGSGDLSTAHGAGYATMFLLNAAAMGLPVYGPAILQTLRGLSALVRRLRGGGRGAALDRRVAARRPG